jgi:hypothetical protein
MYCINTEWLCCHMKWQWHMKNEESFQPFYLQALILENVRGGTSCSWMFFSQKLDLIYIIKISSTIKLCEMFKYFCEVTQ